MITTGAVPQMPCACVIRRVMLLSDKGVFCVNFTEVKRGYDPIQVNEYIENLESIIKGYQEKDNSIKNAIISAQVAADNMIKNARLQADEYKQQIGRELENVRIAVEHERAKVQEFQDIYTELVHKYLTKLDSRDIDEITSRLDEIDRLIDHLMVTDANMH